MTNCIKCTKEKETVRETVERIKKTSNVRYRIAPNGKGGFEKIKAYCVDEIVLDTILKENSDERNFI